MYKLIDLKSLMIIKLVFDRPHDNFKIILNHYLKCRDFVEKKVSNLFLTNLRRFLAIYLRNYFKNNLYAYKFTIYIATGDVCYNLSFFI